MTEERFLELEEQLEYMHERIDVVEEALQHILQKELKSKERFCEICDIQFTAKRSAKYCSNACRQKAYHDRT